MILGVMSHIIVGLAAVVADQPRRPVQLRAEPPEIPHQSEDDWVNSKPLKFADLKGKVVVINFWTFGWINCIRNYPWYKGWQEKYSKKGVVIIGVHTPETNGEKNVEQVREKAKENGLEYPIVIDNDKQIWNEWENQWWPSTYLIDKNGIARYRWDGELNWKEQKGEVQMRKKIEELLNEPGPREVPQKKSKSTKS